jgi:hypothetical protein
MGGVGRPGSGGKRTRPYTAEMVPGLLAARDGTAGRQLDIGGV